MDEFEIRQCSVDDLSLLVSAGTTTREMQHHNERFQMQVRDEAVYLLAWRHTQCVGKATLLLKSRYGPVLQALGKFPEINALEAIPQNTGTGTRLIRAAEELALARGAITIGLAVEDSNDAAHRLYDRLGYVEWSDATVIDNWFERDEAGNPTIEHNDECHYLVKILSIAAGATEGPKQI